MKIYIQQNGGSRDLSQVHGFSGESQEVAPPKLILYICKEFCGNTHKCHDHIPIGFISIMFVPLPLRSTLGLGEVMQRYAACAKIQANTTKAKKKLENCKQFANFQVFIRCESNLFNT